MKALVLNKIILTGILILLTSTIFSQTANFLWATNISSTGTLIRSNDVAVDHQGNIYSTGIFQMTADFDPGSGVQNLTSNGFADIFIQKTDSAGQLVWVKQLGKSSWNEGTAITTDDSSNVYIAGHFNDTVDFNPGPGIHNITSTGGQDLFILKLDSVGNFSWGMVNKMPESPQFTLIHLATSIQQVGFGERKISIHQIRVHFG